MRTSQIAVCVAALSVATVTGGELTKAGKDVGATVNSHLAAKSADFRLASADCLGSPGNVGPTIFFINRGNKQMQAHFVPRDPRRGGFADISWINDLVDGDTASELTAEATDAAIGRAMATWQGVQCSSIPLTSLGSFKFDFGIVQNATGFGGSPDAYADITHGGWLPKGFFNTLASDGGDYILGVTFTFVFIDPQTKEPTDIDRNGKLDVAFAETYYNDAFPWGIDVDLIDVETVALHEVGHGLSQEHFGKAFLTPSNGRLHFSPRAVMNAGYSGLQQDLTSTDLAGHCGIWASWPTP